MMKSQEETSRNLRLIVNSSYVVLIGVILSKIISYFYKIIVARGFGPEIFGLFSLGLIIVGIVGAAASLGLAEGLLRYVSFYRGKKESNKIKFIVNRAVKLMFFTSILGALLLFAFSDFISTVLLNEPELSYFLKILGISLPFSMLSGAFVSIIRAFENIRAYSFLVNVLHNLLKVFFLLILLWVGLKRDAILFSYVLAYVGLFFVSYWITSKQLKSVAARKKELSGIEKENIARSLFSYSWPLVFSSILLNLFFWIDSLILGIFTNAESVGLYNAAITIVGLFSIAQDLFMQIFIPVISRNLSLGKKEVIKEVSKQVFKWILIINLPLFLILFLFPGVIINLFFGAEYLFAEDALKILALGALFSGFMSLFIGLISTKGKTKKTLAMFIVFSVLNVILDIILIPIYGIEGAASATAIVWVIFTITLFINIKKEYGFYPIKKAAIKIAFVSIIPSLILYVMSENLIPNLPNLILSGVVFAVIYILLIFITKSLDNNDWEIINSIKTKFGLDGSYLSRE